MLESDSNCNENTECDHGYFFSDMTRQDPGASILARPEKDYPVTGYPM